MSIINRIRYQLFVFRAKLWALYMYVSLINKRYSKNSVVRKEILKGILHINSTDSIGGAAKIAHELCSYQRSKLLQSTMMVGKKKSTDNFVFELVPKNNRKQHFLFAAQETLQWQDFFQLSSLEINNHKAFRDADIIHLHNLHGNYFSPFAIPLITNKKIVIWSFHDEHAFTGHCAYTLGCERWQIGCGNCPDLNIYPALKKDTTQFIFNTKRKIYNQSNIIIVVLSDWLRKKAEKSMLSHFPIYTIYNGVDTSIYKPQNKQQVRAELGIDANINVVLFSADMGINNPFKGGSYIKNIVELNDTKNILFINVGGGTAIEKNKFSWSVPYITQPTEMAKYYAAADIYLYPTLADNCPLVVLEAMACGLPVVTFATGGVPELVEHNKTGYVAKYKDVDDLNTGFVTLLNNPQLRMEMAANAVLRVNEKFTLEMMNENYLKLYKQILMLNTNNTPTR
jgi:glycosyltransferase involved in cell wall biosynthesis